MSPNVRRALFFRQAIFALTLLTTSTPPTGEIFPLPFFIFFLMEEIRLRTGFLENCNNICNRSFLLSLFSASNRSIIIYSLYRTFDFLIDQPINFYF